LNSGAVSTPALRRSKAIVIPPPSIARVVATSASNSTGT
jgi:hypothetical protein